VRDVPPGNIKCHSSMEKMCLVRSLFMPNESTELTPKTFRSASSQRILVFFAGSWRFLSWKKSNLA
jgi:hypothetical protein